MTVPEGDLGGHLCQRTPCRNSRLGQRCRIHVSDDIKKIDLEKEINSLFAGEADCALFFFSGHGYIDTFGGYIVTSDYNSTNIGVKMKDILNVANKSKCKNRIIILDCCYSGSMGKQNRSMSTSTISDGLTVLSACRDYEKAIECGEHGLFSSLLINGLKGEAADLLGEITPGNIYAYIDRTLGPWEQRPVFKTNISKFISLRKVKEPISRDDLHEIIKLFEMSDTELYLDPSFEFTNDPNYNIEIIEPHANPDNVNKLKILQRLESVGLVKPIDEKHLYFAAMHSKRCKLTESGKYYWNLVTRNRI